MLKIIEVKEGVKLNDYELYASLALELRELFNESSQLIPLIKNRKIWMLNSTEQGGGVAEMMPRIISFFRQLGLESEWVISITDNKDFFRITKNIHNLIHGGGNANITSEDKDLYEKINRENAEEFSKLIQEDDIVVINDPQPVAMGQYISKIKKVNLIWRCHIGLDRVTPNTEYAWNFLKPYLEHYKSAVFSAAEYIPSFLVGKSSIIYPSIDPLDHKNRYLPFHKIIGVLSNSDIIPEYSSVLTPDFDQKALKLQLDGTFGSPIIPEDPGITFKPYVLQVSRWDKLKGFIELMRGFTELKINRDKYGGNMERHSRRLDLVNLVLAGPDPDFVEDDPEGRETLKEIIDYYMSLPSIVKRDIVILKLPMASRKNNELIVNALQSASTFVVQNSISEGFGLTATEAMWKIKPIIGSNACGLRQQIREGVDGLFIKDPTNPEEVAYKLNLALSKPKLREVWSHNSQKRVIQNFLIFTQIKKWIRLFTHCCSVNNKFDFEK